MTDCFFFFFYKIAKIPLTEHTIYTNNKIKHGRMPQNECEKSRWVEGETYPSEEYYEMDVLLLMQHKERSHGFTVAATSLSATNAR